MPELLCMFNLPIVKRCALTNDIVHRGTDRRMQPHHMPLQDGVLLSLRMCVQFSAVVVYLLTQVALLALWDVRRQRCTRNPACDLWDEEMLLEERERERDHRQDRVARMFAPREESPPPYEAPPVPPVGHEEPDDHGTDGGDDLEYWMDPEPGNFDWYDDTGISDGTDDVGTFDWMDDPSASESP